MRKVDCPICEADQASSLFCVEGMQLVRCLTCGLTYYNPDVTPEEHYALLDEDFFVCQAIQKLKKSGVEYNFDAYLRHVKDPSIIGYPDYLEPEHLLAKELWGKKTLAWFVKKWQELGFAGLPSSLLEAGGASGHMALPFVRAEWDPVVVQEVSPWISQFALSGVEMRLGELHTLDFGDTKFNCVLMWDSFEHIQFPNECLRRLYEVTTDEMLMIIQTPDVDFATADWYLFSPSQHSFLYNHRTLALILEKHGFSICGEKISPEADEMIVIVQKKLGRRRRGKS